MLRPYPRRFREDVIPGGPWPRARRGVPCAPGRCAILLMSSERSVPLTGLLRVPG